MAGIEAQRQIRENTKEIHEFLKDLQDWEKVVKAKDSQLKTRAKSSASSASQAKEIPPIRRKPSNEAGRKAGDTDTAAKHTHEYFRDKWDKFDVDAALKEIDEEDNRPQPVEHDDMSAGIPQIFASESRQHVSLDSAGGTDANSEKELGNQYFKEKKYAQAIECYSRSLALQPTAVAYANRAMALLKIRRYEDAELDCSEAITLDDRYTKAYARRGTAKKELNKLLEAVEDFEFALRLEPHNKELEKQYQEAKEAYEKKNPFRPQVKEVQLKIRQSDSSSLPDLRSSKQKTAELDDDKKEKLKVVASRAAASVMNAKVQNMEAPNTSYEFETLWRGLGDDSAAKARLVKLVNPVSLPRIFKDNLSAGLMVEIVQTLHSCLPDEPSFVVQVLDNLTRVGRFSMTVMFLTNAHKAALKALWEAASKASGIPMEDLDKLEMLRGKYRIQ